MFFVSLLNFLLIDSQLFRELLGVLSRCSSLISFMSCFKGSISLWIIDAKPANSLFSSATKSVTLSLSFVSMFDVCIGAVIVVFWVLYCLFEGGFLTSLGLFEAGLLHFLSAVCVDLVVLLPWA